MVARGGGEEVTGADIQSQGIETLQSMMVHLVNIIHFFMLFASLLHEIVIKNITFDTFVLQVIVP